MNKHFGLLAIIGTSLLFSSCNSKFFKHKRKKETADTTTATTSPTSTSVSNNGGSVGITPIYTDNTAAANSLAAITERLLPIWKKRLDYKTFSGKAKINFDGPKGNVGFSANFRIAKDSLIWVHVTALGGLYPVARMLVTTDSFFLINYDQKEVTRTSIAQVGKILPVSVQFRQLQNLFSGEPLADGSIIYAEEKDSAWVLSTDDSTFLQRITYQRPDSNMVFADLQTHEPNGPHALASYMSFQNVTGRLISTSRNYNIQNGLKTYVLDMNFVNPEFDKNLEFPFSMPANFKVNNPQ